MDHTCGVSVVVRLGVLLIFCSHGTRLRGQASLVVVVAYHRRDTCLVSAAASWSPRGVGLTALMCPPGICPKPDHGVRDVQAYLSAQQSTSAQEARLPASHADAGWTLDSVGPSPQGPRFRLGLIPPCCQEIDGCVHRPRSAQSQGAGDGWVRPISSSTPRPSRRSSILDSRWRWESPSAVRSYGIVLPAACGRSWLVSWAIGTQEASMSWCVPCRRPDLPRARTCDAISHAAEPNSPHRAAANDCRSTCELGVSRRAGVAIDRPNSVLPSSYQPTDARLVQVPSHLLELRAGCREATWSLQGISACQLSGGPMPSLAAWRPRRGTAEGQMAFGHHRRWTYCNSRG